MDTKVELEKHHDYISSWLRENAYPLWWNTGADQVNGGFFETIELDGAPSIAPRRARVAPRQIYCYSVAEKSGWHGPWQDAIQHGLDYFLEHYALPDGTFGAVAAPDGTLTDTSFDLYNQAFALFSFAAIATSMPARRAEMQQKAEALLHTIDPLRHPLGGFYESKAHTAPLASNPHMHMFEAAQAWEAIVGPDSVWSKLADDIAQLCLTRFIDAETGALREFFDENWAPYQGLKGRIVEPGHQFEWAWLLTRWGTARCQPDAIAAARRLFKVGFDYGICPTRHMARMQLLDDFSIHDDLVRLWPQTEWIKAAIALAELSEGEQREQYIAAALDGAKALRPFLDDIELRGLWRDKQTADGAWIEEAAPASSFYHIVCANIELGERLAALKGL